jgi:hypothetical protein
MYRVVTECKVFFLFVFIFISWWLWYMLKEYLLVHGWGISWMIWHMSEAHILVHGWGILWMIWHMFDAYLWYMIYGYYNTYIMAYGLRHMLVMSGIFFWWSWHMIYVSGSSFVDDDVSLSMTGWLSVIMIGLLSVIVSVTGWVYTYILGRNEGERKGVHSLLLIWVGEYRELELPSGWSL